MSIDCAGCAKNNLKQEQSAGNKHRTPSQFYVTRKLSISLAQHLKHIYQPTFFCLQCEVNLASFVQAEISKKGSTIKSSSWKEKLLESLENFVKIINKIEFAKLISTNLTNNFFDLCLTSVNFGNKKALQFHNFIPDNTKRIRPKPNHMWMGKKRK